MDDSEPQTSTLPINFGKGLVEVGALTTLIGSTIAAVLVLGKKGPAGIVWGTISAFGSSSVVKACASGATPGWFRQMVNLRTPVSDAALGLDLPLSPSFKLARMARTGLDQPIGVFCDAGALEHASPMVKEHPSCRDVYVFDDETQFILDGLPATSPGDPLKVYEYSSYPFFWSHGTWHQTSLLSLSLLKYSEAYFLFRGSMAMAILSAAPFTFFLLAAICLEINELISSRRPMKTDGQLDIVAGPLPSVKQLGGPRKIFLGATKNVRNSLRMKIIWTVGAVLYLISLLISYVLLDRHTTDVVITWAVFQVTWLVLRILISHLKGSSEVTGTRRIIANEIQALTLPMKLRVANLILAVANCLQNLHPRGLLAYAEDSYSIVQITRMLVITNMRQVYVLPREHSSSIQLNVVAVIGDVTLSSAAWMLGSKFTPMDVYDSCIIVLSQGQPQGLIAIPSARVLTAKANFQTGVNGSEKVDPLFVPRTMAGGSEVSDPEWMYWIPCQSGNWLQFKSTNLLSLGKRTADVLNDDQLTKVLSAGNLHISLKISLEVKEIVDIARKAAELLVSVFN
ncbi:hypothetical protein CPB84DRAFT_1845237 [Gymnopilus junonius]|uniref:Uncharacterized protein n=1 Tax=Gymnopilus junonius TaxID=109634 RepID=A0A9P5NUP1_GYMJU|nr:hypothetical protein CPB84DRAFT_1845237 [Gymnopilus junonius]